jgi:hypothetical protein
MAKLSKSLIVILSLAIAALIFGILPSAAGRANPPKGGTQVLRPVGEAPQNPSATVQKWRLSFQAGDSGFVAIRGLEFFSGGKEVFPPPVPYTGSPISDRP